MTRVLSVEDDPELQHLLSLALSAAGFVVHYAFTGPEGYEKALELEPDAIVCDMMLPGLSGPDLLVKLKEHERLREVPVIVTTAFSEAPEALEAKVRPLGIVEYLRKPFQIEELVRVLRRVTQPAEARGRPPPIRKGRFRLDPAQRTVWIDDRLIASLTDVRFAVLRELARAAGPVARAKLMRAVWGRTGRDATLEKTIQRLRENLGAAADALRTTDAGYELAG